ncbi:hypothetical protein KCP75_06625 [Salmonella enterica subsp. enterica]|nr:hypothetical protein KCP75_06625 [Salmonella enterica subsp. enterica]
MNQRATHSGRARLGKVNMGKSSLSSRFGVRQSRRSTSIAGNDYVVKSGVGHIVIADQWLSG